MAGIVEDNSKAKLSGMTVKYFSEVLASDAPTPGGGSAAALSGVLGVALTHMVAALTVDKQIYEEHRELMKELMIQADGLRIGLVDIIDKDTEAFGAFMAAMSMPRETDGQKAKRSEMMQAALEKCTLTPFEIMRCSFAALELTERAMGKSNTNLVSDLGVAAISLKAAVQSAWLNVLINIGSLKDKALAEKYRSEGEKILAETIPLADKIYARVAADLWR